MQICISTIMEVAKPTEVEKKRCGLMKCAEGDVYIFPESLYARHRLNAIRALGKAKFSIERHGD